VRPAVAIVGPGRLGQTLARLLGPAGYRLQAVVSRDPERAKAAAAFAGVPGAASCDLRSLAGAELVLLSVPDDHITACAAAVEATAVLAPETVLAHCSGIHPAALLKQVNPQRPALSLHPLQTFASPEAGVAALPGSPWSLEGDDAARPRGEALIRALGGEPFHLDAAQKPLYHAAASVTANFQAALFRAACEMLGGCGFTTGEARHLLTPLFATSARNIAELGPEAALTGPIARGDVQTVATHLAALTPLSPDLQQLYRSLARQTIKTALAKGSLAPAAAEMIARLLDTP